MKSRQSKVGLHIMTTSRGRWVLIQAAIINLTALSTTVLVRPLHSHHTPFDSKTMALRLVDLARQNSAEMHLNSSLNEFWGSDTEQTQAQSGSGL